MDTQTVQPEASAEAQARTQGDLDQPTIDLSYKIVAHTKKTRYYKNNEDNKPLTKR